MATDDDSLREQLGRMLADGLKTNWENRAYNSEQVAEVIDHLQSLAADNYKQKLVIGGFTAYPYGDDPELPQSCETCMYYLKHRRYCELPELAVPVEPQWSCIVWRI